MRHLTMLVSSGIVLTVAAAPASAAARPESASPPASVPAGQIYAGYTGLAAPASSSAGQSVVVKTTTRIPTVSCDAPTTSDLDFATYLSAKAGTSGSITDVSCDGPTGVAATFGILPETATSALTVNPGDDIQTAVVAAVNGEAVKVSDLTTGESVQATEADTTPLSAQSAVEITAQAGYGSGGYPPFATGSATYNASVNGQPLAALASLSTLTATDSDGNVLIAPSVLNKAGTAFAYLYKSNS